MAEKYKIIGDTWFTTQDGMNIGVIAIARDHDESQWKAYIGSGGGVFKEVDMQYIAANGAKITDKFVACAFFPELPVKGFVA